jgi:hypothetical protein
MVQTCSLADHSVLREKHTYRDSIENLFPSGSWPSQIHQFPNGNHDPTSVTKDTKSARTGDRIPA